MHNLTVAYASGNIAATVHVLQFVVPNVIIMILASVIRNEHSAVTWSVVGRALHSSSWPVLLQSDSAASEGVSKRVAWLTWLKAGSFGLLAIAAIITPLGLYESIEPSSSVMLASFVHVPDSGPMGYGTPSRSDQGFSRICGYGLYANCPGQNLTITYSGNFSTVMSEEWNGTYDVRIPQYIAELFQSGLKTQMPSVSSFFDIQSRQYGFFRQPDGGFNNDSAYVVDLFRQVNSVVLDDAVEVFEGVVVDTQTGGVGFRDHTIPEVDGLAVEWAEDLLFIQPETECVDMNIAIDFTVGASVGASVLSQAVSLVDNGGFSNLSHHYVPANLSDPQYHPNLRERAYNAAWVHNALTMVYLNVTRPSPHAFAYVDSVLGKSFPIQAGSGGAKANKWTSSQDWASHMDLYNDTSNSTDPATIYPNPFGVTFANFTEIATLCQGAGGGDYANSSNIGVLCGRVYGAAKLKYGGNPLIFKPNTSWTQPLYACASTTKALLRVVNFRYNLTDGTNFRSLQVLNISDKVYPNPKDIPTWGMENLDLRLADVNQLWGLVDKAYSGSANLSLFEKEHLYLPGYDMGVLDSSLDLLGYQYIPAATTPIKVLSAVYNIDPTESRRSLKKKDYSGLTDAAMFTRWQSLSSDAASNAKVINLIWTDIAANYLLGTRSWNSGNALPPNLAGGTGSSTDSPPSPVKGPVYVIAQRLRYRWPYAIPAVLFLVLVMCIAVVALACAFRGSMSPATIRKYLNATSAGRLLVASEETMDAGEDQCERNVWIRSKGMKIVSLGRDKQAAIPLSSMSDGRALLGGYEYATTGAY